MIIYYIHGEEIDDLEYNDGDIIDDDYLYDIVENCISKKYSIMIQPNKDKITVWIGKGTLSQH